MNQIVKGISKSPQKEYQEIYVETALFLCR